jgi:hypothetical protein
MNFENKTHVTYDYVTVYCIIAALSLTVYVFQIMVAISKPLSFTYNASPIELLHNHSK